jgi:hypothetical protein
MPVQLNTYKMGFALLAIGLIASFGIAASDCINLRTIDKNGEGISGVEVFMDAVANKAGETNSSGYLLIPLGEDEPYIKDHAKTNDNVWNITTSKGTKTGWATVTVPPGTCENVTISMLY